MAIQYKRATPESWLEPIIKGQPKFGKRKGTIMMPTTHDITAKNVDEFIVMMTHALDEGNDLLIVSKPIPHVIAKVRDAIPPAAKARVLFRFSIGSVDDKTLRLWEPFGPKFGVRMKALMETHALGFRTSVSAEPMLDADADALIVATLPYITDAIWMGKANMLKARVSMNTRKDPKMMASADELNNIWTDDAVRVLYAKHGGNPQVKWKESMKEILGLDRPTEAGLDI
jgi:DNA repair photolyase